MTLNTHVNLAESDKGSFYNQKEWLQEYKHGKGMFYSEYDNDKNCGSSEDIGSYWEESSSEEDENSDSNTEKLPTAYNCCIVFSLFFSLSSPTFYYSCQAMR